MRFGYLHLLFSWPWHSPVTELQKVTLDLSINSFSVYNFSFSDLEDFYQDIFNVGYPGQTYDSNTPENKKSESFCCFVSWVNAKNAFEATQAAHLLLALGLAGLFFFYLFNLVIHREKVVNFWNLCLKKYGTDPFFCFFRVKSYKTLIQDVSFFFFSKKREESLSFELPKSRSFGLFLLVFLQLVSSCVQLLFMILAGLKLEPTQEESKSQTVSKTSFCLDRKQKRFLINVGAFFFFFWELWHAFLCFSLSCFHLSESKLFFLKAV